MTTDTIKQLGAEFHYAADGVGEALQRLERARVDRLAFLRRCSKDSTARLATLKEEIRTLPEQIAKWDAEAARLESQTAEDLLRQALEPGQEQPKPEPYRAGLPPERLRKVWAEWEDETGIVQLRKNGDGWEYRYAHWPNEQEWGDVYSDIWGSANIRPHGATWARVEAMADEAEPTLLDLTKLPPGTVCEATGDIQRWNGKLVVELAKQAGAVDVQAVSDLLVLKCQVKGETVELAAFSPFSTASDTLRRSVGRVATV